MFGFNELIELSDFTNESVFKEGKRINQGFNDSVSRIIEKHFEKVYDVSLIGGVAKSDNKYLNSKPLDVSGLCPVEGYVFCNRPLNTVYR